MITVLTTTLSIVWFKEYHCITIMLSLKTAISSWECHSTLLKGNSLPSSSRFLTLTWKSWRLDKSKFMMVSQGLPVCFLSSWRASKHAGAPLSNAHWSLLKGKPTGLPLETGNTRRKEGRGVWVKRRSDIIKRRTEVNMHAREGAYRLLLFTQQCQYFIRAGGVTHSYVRSELFFICCSEYACVGRCVAFLGRRVKLRTVQLYNASWKRLNATSCRTVTLSQCTYTQSDTAVNQTHSHTQSVQFCKPWKNTLCMLEITEAVQCHVINHRERIMCLGVSVKVETTVAFKVILEGNARSPCARSASDCTRAILWHACKVQM